LSGHKNTNPKAEALEQEFLFLIADKSESWGGYHAGKKAVGVVRNKELKLEDGEASHTLGATGEGGTYGEGSK